MSKLVIYTAAFGNHDTPAELPGLRGVADLICFTDRDDLRYETWTVLKRRSVFRSSRMDAKWYKMSACHLFPEHMWSIYLDASIRVKDSLAMVHVIDRALQNQDDVAFFSHPEEQRSLEQEAAFSMTMPKYAGEPCIEQVQHYRSAGFHADDPDYHLYAGGVIGRTHWESAQRFEKSWFDECVHWSAQDQLSLPYVLWREGLKPGIIPGSIYDCSFLGRVWSGPR